MSSRLSRHASNKAPTSINIISKLCSFINTADEEFDQTTDYSLVYSEENSVIEGTGHFEYLAGSSEQENTVTTYCTEGTPFQTPLYFSASTSTSDLLKIDDIKISNTVNDESKRYISPHQLLEIIKQLEKSKEKNQIKNYKELKYKDHECESMYSKLCLPQDLEDYDYKCDEDTLERIINVTPSQSPTDLCDKNTELKVETYRGEDNYIEQTPLMFSRCSSLGSLSGYEQQSTHDDHSSLVSEFSQPTSEVASPTELPDSPAQILSSTSIQSKNKNFVRKKIQQQSKHKNQSPESCLLQKELSKCNIFEDDMSVFKEESTPNKYQSVAESSLSSLTIDDDDEVDEAGAIKTLKSTTVHDGFNNINEEEEKIFDECVRKGIAKVTGQNINDVSSLNSTEGSYDENKFKQTNPCENTCRPEDSLDEEIFYDISDLTTEEEEKLLDEYIRKGIAKVTGQNINDISSLTLMYKFSGHSSISSFDKNSLHDVSDNSKEDQMDPIRDDIPRDS